MVAASESGDRGTAADAESQRLAERVLDVFVFAPVGIAETCARWVPRVIATGRQRVEQQVRTARWIGEMAVGMGRTRLSSRFHRTAPPPHTAASSTSDVEDRVPSLDEPFDGYDSVPASDLVAMLARLTRAELESVRRYETAGRGRRTVLARLDQLLAI